MRTRTFFTLAAVLVLSACTKQTYEQSFELTTELKYNGEILGPKHMLLQPDTPREFDVKNQAGDILSYSINLEEYGEVTVTPALKNCLGPCSEISQILYLPSMTLVADGQQAGLEFQTDDEAPLIEWTLSVKEQQD